MLGSSASDPKQPLRSSRHLSAERAPGQKFAKVSPLAATAMLLTVAALTIIPNLPGVRRALGPGMQKPGGPHLSTGRPMQLVMPSIVARTAIRAALLGRETATLTRQMFSFCRQPRKCMIMLDFSCL